MVVWGMVGNSHDASLAVFLDGKLVWASLAKDFSDVPNDPKHSWTQIEAARQSYGPPDKVVWYEKPILKTLRQYWAGQGWLLNENNIKKYLAQWDIDVPVKYIQHHESHAAYGYYTSGKLDAYVMCLDSIGEFETLTLWHGKGNKLKKIYSQRYPHSVGLFYSAMTQRCGFKPNAEEYKISELAKQISITENLPLINDVSKTFIDGDLSGKMPGVHFKVNLHKGANWYKPDLTTEDDMIRLANATQSVFEMIVMSNSKWLKNQNYSATRDMIVTGGCALNRDAMDRLRTEWKSVWVPPNPGDPGSCVGAVLAMNKKHIDFNSNIWYNNDK